MHIRLAQKADLNCVNKVVEEAFSDEENATIKALASALFTETTNPPIKSLVAEIDHQIMGYISFSPIFVGSDTNISGYILAPLAVSPNCQKQGIGSALIKSGIDMLSKDHIDFLLVYGDPDYYGRFGFKEEFSQLFIPPYPLKYPFGWTGMKLSNIPICETPVNFSCVTPLRKPELW